MNRRLLKEFRAQLPALAIAALLACILPLRWFLSDQTRSNTLAPEILDIAPLFLVLALCVAASVMFTSEFHFRTLQLVLAQPISRMRIWAEKSVVMLTGILTVVLLYIVVRLITPKGVPGELPLLLILLTTLCSAAFWSLVGRSVIGAVALNLGFQAFLALLVNAAYRIAYSFEEGPEEGRITAFMIVGGIYAPTMVWLGWRRFRSLQVCDLVPHADPAAGELAVAGGAARAGTVARIGRLPMVRKELRLQRPACLLGGLFASLWVIGSVIGFIFPRTRGETEGFLLVLLVFYVPVMVILAGCISISDENRIGIFEWHLTFPVSRCRIWTVKVGVALISAAALGVLLPLVLAGATSPVFRQAFFDLAEKPDKAVPLVFALVMLLVLSFWSASYLRDVVRSTLGSVVAMVSGGALALCMGWVASQANPAETGLVSWFIAWQQLTSVQSNEVIIFILMVLWFGGLPLLLGWQSWRAIRGNWSGAPSFVRSTALVLAIVAGLGFLSVDLLNSSYAAHYSLMQAELSRAAAKVPDEGFGPKGSRKVSLEELERSGELSRVTRYWVRNCTFELRPNSGSRMSSELVVSFPRTSDGEWITVDRP